MRVLLVTFLILSALLLLETVLSCAAPVQATKFDGKWKFIEVMPGEQMACLSEDDVKKLREQLIRCRGGAE